MKKILIFGSVLLMFSLTACGGNDPMELDSDSGSSGYFDVEPDPFYFPYCELAIVENPEMYSTVEGCAQSYTRNEQSTYKDCLTRSSEEYCWDFIEQGRVIFTECADGITDYNCW